MRRVPWLRLLETIGRHWWFMAPWSVGSGPAFLPRDRRRA